MINLVASEKEKAKMSLNYIPFKITPMDNFDCKKKHREIYPISTDIKSCF